MKIRGCEIEVYGVLEKMFHKQSLKPVWLFSPFYSPPECVYVHVCVYIFCTHICLYMYKLFYEYIIYLKILFDWNIFIHGFMEKVTIMNQSDNIIFKNIYYLNFQLVLFRMKYVVCFTV